MDSITVNAYAKINLSLDILGTLPNGYHEVQMIMQSLTLHDTLTLTRTEENDILLTCSDLSLPVDEKNLAYRAAASFLKHFNILSGISIDLKKKIPCAAGLAGGSSDAAAVLRGMNELFATNASEEELAAIGVTLGADVPYCLFLGTALSEGIGERLTRLPAAPDCFCLLVKPEAGASTGQIYKSYDALEPTGVIAHPQTDLLLTALRTQDYPLLCEKLCNVLEPVTARLVPEVDTLRRTLTTLGADGVRMSGSGPTVFGLFSDEDTAEKAAGHMKAAGYYNTFLTKFFQPDK